MTVHIDSDDGWAVAAAVIVPAVVVSLLFGGLVMFAAIDAAACDPSGGASDAAVSVDPDDVPKGPIAGYRGEQLVNAAIIMLAIQDLGMSKRDQQIAVMTAMGESSLQVLDYGDNAGPDSRGLFQQRANGAWGSYADRMDPATSATNFGKALKQISGRDTMTPTLVAHKVQRNADPYYYTPFWDPAGKVVDALAGIRPTTPTTATGGAGGGRSDYDLGPVLPATKALANTLGAMFDLKDIGGWRPDDPYPDHPGGWALDLMVYNDTAKGDKIAAYLQANADTFGVYYLIWQQRIWTAARASEGWRPMADRGSPTANHMDHVHVSLDTDADAVTNPPGAGGSCAATGLAAGQWTKPVNGPFVDTYGWRIHPITGERKFHYGTDLNGGGCNAPIFAAAAGTVTYAGASGGYGNLIEIDHGNKVHTRYGHMYNDGVAVRAGDIVTAGQQIGKVGSNGMSTGCHLHFEVTLDGEYTNPYVYLTKQLGRKEQPV